MIRFYKHLPEKRGAALARAQPEVRESGVRLLRSLLPGCVCDGKASKLSRKNEAAVRVVLATKKFGRGRGPDWRPSLPGVCR